MLADPNARVIVDIKTDADHMAKIPINPPTLVAYIDKDFSFSSDADWTSPYESFGGIFRFLQSIRNLFQTLGTQVGLDVNLPTAMSFAQTIKDYMGSTPPKFTLDLTFIATKSGNSQGPGTQVYPLNAMTTLLACTSPTRNNVGPLGLMGVPLGYKHDLSNPTNGVIYLKVGTWLQIPKLLVKAVRPRYSKEVGVMGLPIYTVASVDFEYYRTPSYEEISSWFTGKNPLGLAASIASNSTENDHGKIPFDPNSIPKNPRDAAGQASQGSIGTAVGVLPVG